MIETDKGREGGREGNREGERERKNKVPWEKRELWGKRDICSLFL